MQRFTKKGSFSTLEILMQDQHEYLEFFSNASVIMLGLDVIIVPDSGVK